jgi:hypothetical protein
MSPRPVVPRRLLALGFLGSTLLAFGGVGAGAVPRLKDAVAELLHLAWVQKSPAARDVSTVLALLGVLLLAFAWWRIRHVLERITPTTILAITALWSLPMLLGTPLFSRDVYAYAGQGNLVANDIDPYTYGPGALLGKWSLGVDDAWRFSPSPYGPVWLWLSGRVVVLSQDHVVPAVVMMRGLAVLGLLLTAWALPRLARAHGVLPQRALWLGLANPFVLIHGVGGAHNDALMIGLALAGLYYCATRRVILGLVLVTLSISVKPITIVFLPFIGLLWAGKNASWPRKFVFWGLTAGISLALLYAMSLVNGFGFGWINGLSAPGSIWIWYAPVGLLGLVVASIFNAFGLDGWGLAKWVYDAGKLLALGIIAWQIFRGDYDRLIRRLTLAFAAVVVLTLLASASFDPRLIWKEPEHSS